MIPTVSKPSSTRRKAFVAPNYTMGRDLLIDMGVRFYGERNWIFISTPYDWRTINPDGLDLVVCYTTHSSHELNDTEGRLKALGQRSTNLRVFYIEATKTLKEPT